MFQGKFRACLKAAYRAGKLVFQGDCALLQNPVEWQRLLATLQRKKWIVYAKAPLAGPQQVLDYLSRYTHRIAIANHRILDWRDGLVRFRYKDYAHGHTVKEMTLSAMEFIRRFLLHILPSGFMRIRHYGLVANRRREEKLARCRALLGGDAAPPAESGEESPPERIARLTGLDLTRCTVCGAGPMRLVERLAPRPQDTS